jgi:cysteine desulfurase
MTALLHGDWQEPDTRSGTLDTPAILRLATTVEIAVADAPRRATLAAPRDYLVARLLAVVTDARLYRDPALARSTGDPSRLPRNAHLSIPGCEGDRLLRLLDAHGIEYSTGSAYTTGLAQPSHVLLAVRTKRQRAGRCTSPSAVPRQPPTSVAAVIGLIVERARRAGPARRPASVRLWPP